MLGCDEGASLPFIDGPLEGELMRHFQTGKNQRRFYVDKDGGKVYVEDEGGETHPHSLDEELDEDEEIESTDPSNQALVPTRPPVRAHLLVCIGQNVGHSFPLMQAEVMIGRDPECDIVVDDRKVSAAHCKIVAEGDMHRVVDLRSVNGVLVNAARVKASDLRHGDLLQVGRSVFRYWVGDPVHGGDDRWAMERAEEEWAVTEAKVHSPAAYQAQGMEGAQPEQGLDVRRDYAYARRRDEEDETSLKDAILQLLRIYHFFRPYWRSILVLLLIGGAAGGASIFWRPPPQKATFQIELTPKAANNPVRSERTNIEFFRSAEQNFKSRKLIKQTLAELGKPAPEPPELKIAQANLEFGVVGPNNPNTYQGQYSHPEADYALEFLQTHVDLYLDREIAKTLKVISVEADFLEKQLRQTEQELKETEQELLAFKTENIDGLPDQAKDYYDYLFELQKKQAEVGKSLDDIKAQLRTGRTQLRTEAPTVETRVVTSRPYQQALVDVRRRIAEAKATGKGPQHPDVLAMQRELASLKKMANSKAGESVQVERERNPLHGQLKDNVAQLRASKEVTEKEAKRLKEDYERVKKIVAKLPELEAQYADLSRSYEATQKLHARIFEQLKSTLLQLELERASASARYDIISPPAIDYVSKRKALMKRGGIGAFMGLLLGLLLAAGRQVRKDLMA